MEEIEDLELKLVQLDMKRILAIYSQDCNKLSEIIEEIEIIQNRIKEIKQDIENKEMDTFYKRLKKHHKPDYKDLF